MKKYPNLFTPLKLGNVVFRNRIVMAPSSGFMLTPEGYVTTEGIAYYEQKAAGGAAAVTIGEGFVHTKTSKSRMTVLPLDEPEKLPNHFLI